ncbi:MAG: endonuclease domain-containing protein [Xanthomonadales bacterium]|nr:endonuclease domain-containing protein [Xanthomonadales bacterium]
MSAVAFVPGDIGRFQFRRVEWDADAGQARLVYGFDDGVDLVERIGFPDAPAPAHPDAFARALRLLHLVAGVSYFKAAVPPVIEVHGAAPAPGLADLLESVYTDGLAEFAWRNGIDLRGRVRFPRGDQAGPAPALHLPRSSLVAIGGGKDSLVSIELLRAAGEAMTLVHVGDSPLIAAVAERTGLPVLNIHRSLAPELFEYNRRGALNGHIPVTAINSAVLVAAAVLYGHDAVVFSNEASASSATLQAGDRVVNHQWSKGIGFERAFAAEVRAGIAADLDYFSLLRPLTELAITRQFARLTRYHAHFSSCNRNFRLLGDKPRERWCGLCPKCHFVFLALAPFLPKPALVGIFGRNLLDDPALAGDFDALLEWQRHKPFECVGEAAESRAALATLAQRPDWREDALVRRFAAEILPSLPAGDLELEPLLVPRSGHALPDRLLGLFDALR